MLQFCTECGAAAEPGKKFCTGCGAKLDTAESVTDTAELTPIRADPVLASAQTDSAYPSSYPDPQAYAPYGPPETPPIPPSVYATQSLPAPVSTAPSAEANAKPIGMWRYLGYLLVMNLPILGLIMSIVWSVRSERAAKLAKAMIIINVLWYALLAATLLMGGDKILRFVLDGIRDGKLLISWIF